MRKIIGIGETIMDIIFKDGQPTAAVPGGSVFNGAISLGRLGQKVSMITETGNDKVGEIIKNFMVENGIDTENVCMYEDGRTAISLAWLNERNDAEYSFYKDYPKARLDVEWPRINKDDIVMMGSYFVLNPILRTKVKEFLATLAKDDNSAKLYKAVMQLLSKDRKGNLTASALLQLERYANEWNDPMFSEGVEIIRNAYSPVETCDFISVSYKDEDGKTHAIPLSLAAMTRED